MLKDFLSLFLKQNCPLCQRLSNNYLCQYCQQKLENCQVNHNSQLWKGDLPLFSWGIYNGELKRAIATMKYNRHPQLGEVFGNWLGEKWRKSANFTSYKKLYLIPIPLHPDKIRDRTFNQAESIAQGFSQVTGYPLLKDGLQRIKNTQALFTLGLEERQQELTEAFSIGKDLKVKNAKKLPILLIDDIYTTGTTAKESTQVLRQNGLEVIGIAVVAKPI